jgi:hypothetical protein
MEMESAASGGFATGILRITALYFLGMRRLDFESPNTLSSRRWRTSLRSKAPPPTMTTARGLHSLERMVGAHDLRGISGKTLKTAREAHPVRSLQRRRREVILPKVVGGSDNLRPQGSSRSHALARILPTSGSSPIQIQKVSQGPDEWGKRDQRGLRINA